MAPQETLQFQSSTSMSLQTALNLQIGEIRTHCKIDVTFNIPADSTLPPEASSFCSNIATALLDAANDIKTKSNTHLVVHQSQDDTSDQHQTKESMKRPRELEEAGTDEIPEAKRAKFEDWGTSVKRPELNSQPAPRKRKNKKKRRKGGNQQPIYEPGLFAYEPERHKDVTIWW